MTLSYSEPDIPYLTEERPQDVFFERRDTITLHPKIYCQRTSRYGHMVEKLRRVISNPRFIRSRLNRYCTEFNSSFHKYFVRKSGRHVFEEDWDVLLILDACRYDDFIEMSELPGETEAIRSRGSDSAEWYDENVNGTDLFDTVCVSANPFTEDYVDRFHWCDLLYHDDFWDDELCTVPPDVVAERVQRAIHRYPNKRILGHFMQPHFPAIGSMRNDLPVSGNPPGDAPPDWSHIGIQTCLRGRVNGVTEVKARQGYRENLKIVLDVVSSLLEDIQCKTVVTADHGELFGELLYPLPCRGILHPKHIRVGPLIEVPWHTPPYSSRREIQSEKPDDDVRTVNEAIVKDRLTALGYQ